MKTGGVTAFFFFFLTEFVFKKSLGKGLGKQAVIIIGSKEIQKIALF